MFFFYHQEIPSLSIVTGYPEKQLPFMLFFTNTIRWNKVESIINIIMKE